MNEKTTGVVTWKLTVKKLAFYDNAGEIGLFDGLLFDSVLAKKRSKITKNVSGLLKHNIRWIDLVPLKL